MVSRSLAAQKTIIPASANSASGKTSVCMPPAEACALSCTVPGRTAASDTK